MCSRYCWPDDLTISRHHLRVHCILYDQDLKSKIAPFVYATDMSVNGTFLKKKKKKKKTDCVGSQDDGIMMGLGSTFLLEHGDELRISDTVRLIFHSMRPIEQAEFTPVQEREIEIFAKDYLITGRLLGEGGYGKVVIGIDQETQRQVACKIVRLDHLYDRSPAPNLRLPTGPRGGKVRAAKRRWPTRVAACFREFEILKDLSHPNIVSIEKVFWSNNTIYILQELVTGGDLFSFIEYKGGRLDNLQAVIVIRQVLLGIEYLHAQEIVHRDLKPDNVLMTSLEDGARVVITDFGSARFMPDATSMSSQHTKEPQRMFSCVGTLEYAAPEIHKMNPNVPVDAGYTKAIDMWSIGSITASVLAGEVIFTDRAHPQYETNPRLVIVNLAAQCDLTVLDNEHHPTWSDVDPLAKAFIKRLLVLDENDRMTATEALAHAWFANDCYGADLEDLYARSVQDWQPRPVDSQLVARISKALPDLSAVGLPGHVMSEESVSRLLHPDEQRLTQNIMQTFSASQHWRADTPLPSIADDYANEDYAHGFASQVQPPPSYGTGIAQRQCNHDESTRHFDTQYTDLKPGDHYAAQETAQHKYPSSPSHHPNSNHDSATQQAAQDKYTHSPSSPSPRSASDQSLITGHHVAYSQYPHLYQSTSDAQPRSQDVILVHETPLYDDYDHRDAKPDGRRGQTRFAEGFDQRSDVDVADGDGDGDEDEDEAEVLVYETPPARERGARW
jgi:serine/threonine protein kinase